MRASHADAFVFFGATGDLAHKHIFPALQRLVRDEGLDLPILGVARRDWSDEDLRARARQSLEGQGGVDEQAFTKLAALLVFVRGDYSDRETYDRLRRRLGDAKRPLHYLAIPPAMFARVAEGLVMSGSAEGARLVLEKPFGRDLQSARELNRVLHRHFAEDAIFRIDHYLGKEPVQNILYTRFANPVFEPIWNRTHVRSIQITMAEAFGVADRGAFFDETGTIRDVLQNHLLQVLATLTMDAPTGQARDAVRAEKVRLLRSIRPLEPGATVRGQYRGYRAVPGVAQDSTVETYVAARLSIDSWRWAGVPIFIRAGKNLPVTASEVLVEFKRPPRETFDEIVPPYSSHMRIRISPDVSIGMGVRVKTAGERMTGSDVELLLTRQTTEDRPSYQRLLGDAMSGNVELFAREDAVEAQWGVVDLVLGDRTPLYEYEPGGWGPSEAQQLVGPDGRWHDPAIP
jgi:glucose-6-phosphate 1-dehydrogenase